MKSLLNLLLSLFLTGSTMAQDPPAELFNSWYYIGFEVDFGMFWPLDVSPPVNPTLIIEPDLSFSGTGACNSFSGTFVYDPSQNTIRTDSFQHTNIQCQYQSHNDLEDEYFGWFEVGNSDPFYVTVNPPNYLTLVALNGFGPHFSTSPLLNTELPRQTEFKTYPNPVNSSLFIENVASEVKFEIYDLNGRSINNGLYTEDGIDVEFLQNGLYLLKLKTYDSSQILKFIKQW